MIVVIADDFSGAAELAGGAFRHGLSAEVQTVFSPETGADVICLDTDTRSLPANEAARRVGIVAERIAAAKPEWIFKKCDSVLRGHVLTESGAIAGVFGRPKVLVVAANPSRGRVVRQGVYWVNNVPLHETLFAADPGHPRRTSRVAELLGADSSDILLPDTETAEDVKRHASTIDQQTLPVGAADFFEALLRERTPPRSRPHESEAGCDCGGDTLLACGSAASWAERRQEAVALGISVFELPYETATAIQRLRAEHRIVMGIGDGAATCGRSSVELLDGLARAIAIILRETRVTRLLTEGGATSAAVMRTLGWTRLRVTVPADEGVGGLRPMGSPGPTLFIKPGSYAWPKTLWPPGSA